MAGLILLGGGLACGKGALGTGSAAGTLGRDLAQRSQAVPRAADVCAMQRALAGPAGAPEKPLAELCASEATSDELWRRAMLVLGAHAERLDAEGRRVDRATAGPLAAALTGVTSPTWIEVEDPAELDARAAVAELVEQLENAEAEKDLDRTVKAAAPQVAALCSGLDPFFDAQLATLETLRKAVEKRQVTRADRRCGLLEGKSLCVGESSLDRFSQGAVHGEIARLMRDYVEAKNALARYCVAHAKLAEAAEKGKTKSGDTAKSLVTAVKGAKLTTLAEVQGAEATAPADEAQ